MYKITEPGCPIDGAGLRKLHIGPLRSPATAKAYIERWHASAHAAGIRVPSAVKKLWKGKSVELRLVCQMGADGRPDGSSGQVPVTCHLANTGVQLVLDRPITVDAELFQRADGGYTDTLIAKRCRLLEQAA